MVVALLVTSCATPSARLTDRAWVEKPWLSVGSMPLECAEALVPYVEGGLVAGSSLENHAFCPDGHICVGFAPLSPQVLGETWLRVGAECGECIRAAEVTISTCNAAVIRHEMGHAFGLRDSGEGMMCATLECGR